MDKLITVRRRLPDVERIKVLEMGKSELWTDQGKEALAYLKEVRKFKDADLIEFEIGYMPQSVTNVNGVHHEFAGRIIIPIRDQYGDIIALSSRDYRKDAKKKFWHEEFIKSNYIYALSVAKKSILKNNKAIVVEGEFDVIQMHSFGIKCTVGMLGSNLKTRQLSLLARYCQEVFLVFDGDQAGLDGLNRTMKIEAEYNLRQSYGIKLIPVYLPQGVDPDDYVKTYGKKTFVELLKKSKETYINRVGEMV
jgi:DNA primase